MMAEPVPARQAPQESQDEQYLRLLSIFHYVCAGLAGMVGCFPIFHVVIGIAIMAGGLSNRGGGPPAVFGAFFAVMGGAVMLWFWAIAVGLAVAGSSLAARRRYMFCLVMAGIGCMFVPVGTALGVFTIVVLVRPSVKAMFGEGG